MARALLRAIARAFGGLNYVVSMPTEISTVDAEDLKSRIRDMRRFL
jgi:hypothetical protein